MMIECPRCGFAQPKDQYCASCGVNIDQFLAKPKPLLVRLAQNPNFHLSLIGILIVVVVGWIVYTQSALVSREVGELLDIPLSSRNAADPNDPSDAEKEAADAAAVEADTNESPEGDGPATAEVADPEAAGGDASGSLSGAAPGGANAAFAAKTADPQRLEVSHWEIPRETLNSLLPTAQRLGEGSGGRAFYWPQGSKVAETLQSAGQSLTAPRATANLQAGAQITGETPPTAPEMFQYGLLVQLTKFENKEASLRWMANFILPQPEAPGETGPAMRSVLESNFAGNGNLAAQGLLMLVVEPVNRTPREEIITRAGFGPWSVFASPEFRAGLTDWVIVLQLK